MYEEYLVGLRKTALVDLKVREVPLQVELPTGPGLEAPIVGQAPPGAARRPRRRRPADLPRRGHRGVHDLARRRSHERIACRAAAPGRALARAHAAEP